MDQISPLEEKFIRTARASGCPKDQVLNFLRAGYIAQPRQLHFHAAARLADKGVITEIGIGGARGGGKSHAVLAQICLDDLQRRSNLKALLLRRIGRAAREAFEDLRRDVLHSTPHSYNKTEGMVTFPNGSRLHIGHYLNERDLDRYLGISYDVIAIEEMTTLSSEKYKILRTCNRTARNDWSPRVYNSTNPGGISHSFYKRRFIDPNQLGTETTTRFIQSLWKDNAFLNPQYVQNLDELTGWMKRAWKDGDWNISAGQFFTTFNSQIHLRIPPSPGSELQIPNWWNFWWGVDTGWRHPTAALLFAQSPSNEVFVVDEYKQSRRLPQFHSAALDQMLNRWDLDRSKVNTLVMGRDAFNTKGDGRSLKDSYEELGWIVEPAVMDRINGWAEVLRRLGDQEVRIEPSLFINPTCKDLIETLSYLEHDPRRPEDILKVDMDNEGLGGDDLGDALRYGLMWVSQETNLVLFPFPT